jgi:hypothetical protein
MSEVLSINEIESRYPNEWILVGDPETNAALEVLTGTVLYHSPNRDDVYRKGVELRPKHSATLYTGMPPDDMEFAL